MSNSGIPIPHGDQYVASIDAGTSSVRVILFDKAGSIAFMEQKELTLETPQSGWVEQVHPTLSSDYITTFCFVQSNWSGTHTNSPITTCNH